MIKVVIGVFGGEVIIGVVAVVIVVVIVGRISM